MPKLNKKIRRLVTELHKVKDEYNANRKLLEKAVGTPMHKVYVVMERKLYFKEVALFREIRQNGGAG